MFNWLKRLLVHGRVTPRFEIVRVSRRWWWVLDRVNQEFIPAGFGVYESYWRPRRVACSGDLENLKKLFPDHTLAPDSMMWDQ